MLFYKYKSNCLALAPEGNKMCVTFVMLNFTDVYKDITLIVRCYFLADRPQLKKEFRSGYKLKLPLGVRVYSMESTNLTLPGDFRSYS